MNFHPLPEEEEITHYLISYLRNGNRLAQTLADRFPVDQGRSFILLPDEIKEAPSKYSKGGVVEGQGVLDLLAFFFQTEIGINGKIIILENPLANRGDFPSNQDDLRFVFAENEVYMELDEGTSGWNELHRHIDFALTAQGLIGYGFGHKVSDELTTLSYDRLVERIEFLVVGVYDNETFLVWQRSMH